MTSEKWRRKSEVIFLFLLSLCWQSRSFFFFFSLIYDGHTHAQKQRFIRVNNYSVDVNLCASFFFLLCIMSSLLMRSSVEKRTELKNHSARISFLSLCAFLLLGSNISNDETMVLTVYPCKLHSGHTLFLSLSFLFFLLPLRRTEKKTDWERKTERERENDREKDRSYTRHKYLG